MAASVTPIDRDERDAAAKRALDAKRAAQAEEPPDPAPTTAPTPATIEVRPASEIETDLASSWDVLFLLVALWWRKRKPARWLKPLDPTIARCQRIAGRIARFCVRRATKRGTQALSSRFDAFADWLGLGADLAREFVTDWLRQPLLSPPKPDQAGRGPGEDAEPPAAPSPAPVNGTPNWRDRDSDGDGIEDAVEGTEDTDGDGTPEASP